MCRGSALGMPFSIDGVPFEVRTCARHQHARASVTMPSGGIVTIYARGSTHEDVVAEAATVLLDVEILAAAESAYPGAHPFSLLPLIGGRLKR